jgi:septal ring-binding cell division protein DamX
MNYYKSIEAEKFNLKSKESAFAPKLDFELSLDNVMDKEGYEEREAALNGLFRLTFNLYNGGKDKNKILTSYSAIREANFKLDEEKKKLKWNISKLFTSIQSTNESLKSNISEVISLRKMVEAYWEEFTLGQQDLQALLQGHKQLNAAETELIKYENNNITDFFTLLGYTGDLLAFFDMDPEHPKFIDFSKSNYSNDVYIDDKFLNEKERLEKEEEIKKAEELRKMFAEKAAKDENIDNFIKKFLATSDEFYTIEIGSFNNQKDATNFIKEKQFDKNAFAYDTVENTNINSKIAYGIFPNMEMAKSESENLSKITNRKTLVVKKVKDVKKLHNDYVVGLKVKLPDPEVQVVEKINTIEKIKQEKKEPEFQYNEAFKNSFLTANKEAYTINITSFNNKNELEKILKANPTLLENSIAYNYSNGTPLIRWDYGIYETYEEAQKAIESLGEVGDSYYPVVQKISKEQELYNANIIPEVKKEIKETEFEYINVSSKVEYKNPIPLKEDKKIENKVQKTESKPAKEKDEEVKEVVKKLEQMPIIKKQEEIKQVSKKPDPKPIKEKDEVEVKEVVKKLEQMPIIKKQEEIKQVSKKADPKPIKEKDEEIVPVTRTIDAKPKKEPDVIDERVPLGGVR